MIRPAGELAILLQESGARSSIFVHNELRPGWSAMRTSIRLAASINTLQRQ